MMKPLLAFIALAPALAVASSAALAQTSTPTGPGAASQARPTRGPEQTSVPTAAPPATANQITGAKNQNSTIKQMNETEYKKIEKEGK